jgi:hypothetical protein
MKTFDSLSIAVRRNRRQMPSIRRELRIGRSLTRPRSMKPDSLGSVQFRRFGLQTEAAKGDAELASVDAIAPSKAWEGGMRCNLQI